MARVHKLLLTLASSSALYSGMVSALGLGDITLHSALNQTLEAEIQLLEADGFSVDDVRVRLASEADFTRSGVERIFSLTDLRFTPLFKGNRSVIRVSSSNAIREPYLSFVVELARPGGRILREYTLLIDPPSSSAYRRVAELPSYAQPLAVKARPPKRVTQLPVAIQGNSYKVLAGDSLWLIARRLMATHPQRSQQALMDDIFALNRSAFIGADSSRLRLGINLVLPDSIVTPVVGGRPSAPAVASETSVAAAANESSGSVTSPASRGSADTAASNAEIALAQVRVDVELAARAEENRQLQAAMLVLQAQLGALQEQMQAKDQQLERVRADLALNPEQGLSSPSVAVPPPVPPALAPVATIVAPSEVQGAWLLWLLGGTSVLLGTLAGLLWRARGRQPEAATEPDRQPLTTARIKVSPLTSARPTPAVAVAVPQIIAPAQASVINSAPATARPAAAIADALEGANIYLAYGRFSEALAVLRKGVQAEPQRLELRLRMLEVLGELGDGAGFAQEEKVLRQQGADSAQLNGLWARFAHLLVAEPEVVLGEVVLDEVVWNEAVLNETVLADDAVLLDAQPLLEEAPSPLLQDDFKLNLEDLSLDADWDTVSPFKTAATVRSKTAALTSVANDPAFRSDLEHLPEVNEVQLEPSGLSPFADWSSTHPAQEPVIDEALVDAFSGESLKHLNKPSVASLEHLAPNRENLVKLNKALAYIAQGNLGSACSILNEVISDGDAQQQQVARELLAKIA